MICIIYSVENVGGNKKLNLIKNKLHSFKNDLHNLQCGKLKEMVSGLTSALMPNEVIEDNKNKLVEYLFANWNQHRIYSYTFFACEVLNFINVIGQIFLLDVFLGGEFTTYGASVIAESEIDPEERTDPMSRVSYAVDLI